MNVAEHSSCNLTSLRLGILPAGQASSYDIVWRAQQELCPTVSCYGITEIWTAPLLSFLDSSVEQRCQSSGFPLPGYEVRVVDPESGVELEEEEHGELLIRGYTLTQGYYKNEAATAEITDDEGWLHTGDEAFIRRDGHVTFLGRLKDMLKVGGENVSPAEVEAHLLSNTDAKEVAVVGVPDSRLGEVPAVFIVNAKGREITQRDVDECCSGRIAGFKIPRYVFAADKLPMTETGKVQKRLLELEATRRVEEMSADA
jgi:fatty-acyl-CoA synthase